MPFADIRDVAANLSRGDYGFALLSGAGLIPVLGDGLKGIGKVVKFIGSNLDNIPLVVNAFEFMAKNFSDDIIKKLSGIEIFQSVMANLSSADNLKITKRKTEMMNEVIEKADMPEYKIKQKPSAMDDVIEGGLEVWDMPIGGGIINGREYSQHALERMAPNTSSVRAELSRRAEAIAESRGLQVGTPEYYQFCEKYVDPRNIPPSVVEDAISNTAAVTGHTIDTFVHETDDIRVIVNRTGKVITVIPK